MKPGIIGRTSFDGKKFIPPLKIDIEKAQKESGLYYLDKAIELLSQIKCDMSGARISRSKIK